MYRKLSFGMMLMLLTFLFLNGCSNSESSESENNKVSDEEASYESSQSDSSGVSFTDQKEEEKDTSVESNEAQSTRKVIYNANLSLQVSDFQKAQEQLELKTKGFGGYIVESNVYREGDNYTTGTMTVRVPADKFEEFINDAEGVASKVIDRSLTGEDVTEEFVDLQSRLKSKRVVEERLLDFMSKAVKTEDLLTISKDLANVQEEIEKINGRIKYLNNQTSFSTVSISFSEIRNVSNLEASELNTWDRTKEQFITSGNFLLSMMSGLIVLLVGNIPVILFLSIISTVVFLIVRRIKSKTSTPPNN